MSFTHGQGKVFTDIEHIRMFGRALRKTGKPVVLVPLGRGLHAGHIALIRAAKRIPGAVVVVSYAGPDTDLPRIKEELIDAIFHFSSDTIWPHGIRVSIHTGPTLSLEDTAVTEVLALLGITQATDVILGEKDYELVVAVQRALNDLHIPVKLHSVPTVRMPDGLAISLRNVDVPVELREQAVSLSAALTAGAHSAEHGAEIVLKTVGDILHAAGVTPDYIEIRGLDMGEAPSIGDARLFAAITLGDTQLHDNVGLPLGIGFKNIEG
ncbi:pantoate-beta-alanine ligase [Corynebacterium deserti GIMN1.010]|uniref:pantoate--beta-alanine ligase (AMP-forming) n=1 Tax=Corynebacterium deserti GIMN1.010 TaxID=931089 RepID=A0A0M4CZR0_9CORY|nr:pantoate--beta-alanine ligase [Corynebacterium deserti]ALC06782.1 pantoate-beta-alanine ligase [Corynebacterium deserti GIMN1.010]